MGTTNYNSLSLLVLMSLLCCAVATVPLAKSSTGGFLENVNEDSVIGIGEYSMRRSLSDLSYMYSFIDDDVSYEYFTFPHEKALCRILDWDSECGSECSCANDGSCDACGASGDDMAYPRYVDYVITGVPPTLEQLAKYPDLQYYPIVAAGVVPVFNIPEVGDAALVLSTQVLARIYLFNITMWNDPAIAELNPSLTLPAATIVPIAQSQDDAATYIFTSSLAGADSTFSNLVGATHKPVWNITRQCSYDTGLLGCVSQTAYSVGYVMSSTEERSQVRTAFLSQNGKTVVNTITSVHLALDAIGSALGNAGLPPSSLVVDLTNAPISGSWPMAGYQYLVLRKNSTAVGRTCVQKNEVLHLFNFIHTRPYPHDYLTGMGFSLLHEIVGLVLYSFQSDFTCEGAEEHYPEPITGSIALLPFMEPITQMAKGFEEGFYAISEISMFINSASSSEDVLDQIRADTTGFGVVRKDFYNASNAEALFDEIVAFPYAAFGWVAMYNLCDEIHQNAPACQVDVASLTVTLDIPTLAGILDGDIQHWNDSAIVQLNPFLENITLPITVISTDPLSEENMMLTKIIQHFVPSFSYAAAVSPLAADEMVRNGVYSTEGGFAVQPHYDIFTPVITHFADIVNAAGNTVSFSVAGIEECALSVWNKESASINLIHTSTSHTCYPLCAKTQLVIKSHSHGECGENDHVIKQATFIRSMIAEGSEQTERLKVPLIRNAMVPLFAYEEVQKYSVVPGLRRLLCEDEMIFPLVEDRQYVPAAVKTFTFFLLVAFSLMCVMAMYWIKVNKMASIVRAAQPAFLNLVIIGCLMMAFNLIPMNMDDASSSDYALDIACEAQMYLYALGSWLVFSALAVKEYRIRKLFVNPNMKRVAVKLRHVLPIIIVGFFVNLLLLLVWHMAGPLRYRRVVTEHDDFNYPVASFGQCDCENSFFWIGALFFIQIAAFVSGCVLAYQVRKLDTHYAEGKWLTVALINQTEVIFISVPLIALVYDTSIQLYAIKLVMIMMQSFAIFGIIIVTKIYRAYADASRMTWVLEEISLSDTTTGNHQKPRTSESMPIVEKSSFAGMTGVYKGGPDHPPSQTTRAEPKAVMPVYVAPITSTGKHDSCPRNFSMLSAPKNQARESTVSTIPDEVPYSG